MAGPASKSAKTKRAKVAHSVATPKGTKKIKKAKAAHVPKRTPIGQVLPKSVAHGGIVIPNATALVGETLEFTFVESGHKNSTIRLKVRPRS